MHKTPYQVRMTCFILSNHPCNCTHLIWHGVYSLFSVIMNLSVNHLLVDLLSIGESCIFRKLITLQTPQHKSGAWMYVVKSDENKSFFIEKINHKQGKHS